MLTRPCNGRSDRAQRNNKLGQPLWRLTAGRTPKSTDMAEIP